MSGKNYTKFPNAMITALGTLNLSSYECRVFFWIVGKTFMWRRAFTYVNATAASKEIGLSRQNFQRALRSLEDRNIVALKKIGRTRAAQILPPDYWQGAAPAQGRLDLKAKEAV